MTSDISRDADAAAALYGVETAWVDDAGERRTASVDAVLEVLARLGAPVADASDLADAARLRRRAIWERSCPPVRVVTAGEAVTVPLRLEASRARGPLEWLVAREGRGASSGRVRVDELGLAGGSTVDGRRFEIRRLELPDLPLGYHRAVLRHAAAELRLPVIVTPGRVYRAGGLEGAWGVFHPLFGLRSKRGAGVGDLRTLEETLAWVTARGGRLFGTTPLLAGFDESPVDPSPYAPASRLFWNELYVHLEAAPGYEAARTAGELSVLEGGAELRDAEHVPWDEVARSHAAALEILADRFFEADGHRRPDFQRFLAERPEAGGFARFMAARRAWGGDWRKWPEPARSGAIPADAVDARIVRRHLFGQWLADRQVAGAGRPARPGGARGVDGPEGAALHLDVPLGTHPDGYDVWRHEALFASGIAAGAPPDDFFRGGQNWGLPPLHPERIREDGFAYVAAVLRHTMRPAGLVRLDHVMQLHRLFWIPAGAGPTDGVYVRYPADELAGVVALESHRAECEVVGEDLGTVPDAVRALMDRWGIRRTMVLGFALDAVADARADAEDPDIAHGTAESAAAALARQVPDGCVATIATHDMFPLAGLRGADDLAERAALGLLDPVEADRLRRRRETAFARLDAELASPGRAAAPPGGVDPLTAPLLEVLGASGAGMVLAPLDDLFGRRLPQNVPGTRDERPNWRRRLPDSLDVGLPPEGERALEVLAASRRRPEPARASA